MNAAQCSFVSLITSSNRRMVIPVYQRQYSWEEEHCIQLWEDILSIGRQENGHHFTGSVVWVQDGTLSAAGVTPLLLIDGQQRMTTLTLLLVALADYAKNNPQENLHFSYEEILGSGYLTNPFKQGEERYKLLLSQGDKETLCSIIDNLHDEDVPVQEESHRLVENLNLFKQRLATLDDPNVVWNGIQRLEVVSISLDQGRDNPQLIFESMNSTGKDLSSADLIRNYVLMALPVEEQTRLYTNYWREIEKTLGADSYDRVFDDFIRNYLTVLYAPEPLARREVYPVFKRHVVNNAYDKDGRIVELLKEMQRYARFYAAITMSKEDDISLKRAFDSIARLELGTLNPLLISFYHDYELDVFDKDGFLQLLTVLESYVFRRSVCGWPSNSLDKFFSSIINRLNKVQDEGGNYVEAFTAYLLNEADSNRRFPNNAEFKLELQTRNSYRFKKSFYLLSRLENHFHPKDPIDFMSGGYTIEHIMPQNALAHEEWRRMLGENYEEDFEAGINNLGNLTLTAYNSELSDASFDEKKARTVGGFGREHLVISSGLNDKTCWDKASIDERAEELSRTALEIWGYPSLSNEVLAGYIPENKAERSRSIKFRDLLNEGIVNPGDVLTSVSSTYPARAIVTDEGAIKLSNGEEFASPSMACIRAAELSGGKSGARNGWKFWRHGEDGPVLDELRKRIVVDLDGDTTKDGMRFRVLFWEGLFEYCSTLPDFTAAFGDQSERWENTGSWVSFGVGSSWCQLETHVLTGDNAIRVKIYSTNPEKYRELLEHKTQIDKSFEDLIGTVKWDAGDSSKKTRSLEVRKPANFSPENWDEMYEWMVSWLWKLKAAVGLVG